MAKYVKKINNVTVVGGGGGGGGITSLNGLTSYVQTFTNDTNVTIVSTGSAHVVTWAGTLADSRIASASIWNGKQAGSANLTSLSGLSYVSGAFVKMTGINTFTLDTNTYLTSLIGAWLTGGNTGPGNVIGTTDSNNWNIIHNNSSRIKIGSTINALADFSQDVGSGTQLPIIKVSGVSHTALTASTDYNHVNIDNRAILQFATGPLTEYKSVYINRPTTSFVGASTITTAGTFVIENSPLAGTNATIINTYSLWVKSGNSLFNGDITATNVRSTGTTFSFLPSVTSILNIGSSALNQTTFTSASFAISNSVLQNTALNLYSQSINSGFTKTINIGIAGVSGSITNLTFGSAISGALGTTTFNSVINSFVNGWTSAGNVALIGSAKIATYAGNSTVGNGVASILGTFSVTGRTTAYTAQSIMTIPTTGVYEVVVAVNNSSPANFTNLTLNYTSGGVGQTHDKFNAFTIGIRATETYLISCDASTALTFTTILAGATTHDILIYVKRIA